MTCDYGIILVEITSVLFDSTINYENKSTRGNTITYWQRIYYMWYKEIAPQRRYYKDNFYSYI